MLDRYLNQRETAAFYETKAYNELTKLINSKEPLPRENEKLALKVLREDLRFKYVEILKAVEWLQANGTFPDRQRCLYPLMWLAAVKPRLPEVLHRASAEEVREHLNEWRRELISVREREKKLADCATSRAYTKFTEEYPTVPDQRRAMVRIYNVHRDKFGPLTLDEPVARALCVALLVTEIEALELTASAKTHLG